MAHEEYTPKHDYQTDLHRVFGEDGTARIMEHVAQGDPTLAPETVLEHAWSLIPETAHMEPATPEDLTAHVISVDQEYRASLRTELPGTEA